MSSLYKHINIKICSNQLAPAINTLAIILTKKHLLRDFTENQSLRQLSLRDYYHGPATKYQENNIYLFLSFIS